MHAPDLDHAAHEIATELHAMAPAHGHRGALAAPQDLAAQVRPHLTPENVAAGMVKGKFNFQKFLENLANSVNTAAPLITLVSGLLGHPITIPPITIPTGPTPGAVPPPQGD